jgi:energy-coupling factor transport system permease protein
MRGPTAWHRLDPLTRLTISSATIAAAIILGGIVAPLLLGLVAVVLPAFVASVLPRVVRLTLFVALPLAVSTAIVNGLFTPAGTGTVAELGPLRVTQEGLWTATQVVVRILVMAGAVSLFYLTTRPAELVASLQAHGSSARLAFVIHGAVAMIPRLAARAAEVAIAQRARGLDDTTSVLQRLRGVLALAGPTVSGAIADAEMRTLALESRGFTRPGRHTLLWVPGDSASQRLARWLMVMAVLALSGLRLAGWAPPW